jgi:phosphoserine aminotransferase
MTHQIYNFNAGPAILPPPVLERAQAELRDYAGVGISVLEMSHRAPEFEAINASAEALLKELMGVGAGWRALFMQGGATTQFSAVPMNLLPTGATADYIVAGHWGERAVAEAKLFGNAHVAASTEHGGFRRVPEPAEVTLSASPAYVHITTNETIHGVQWPAIPNFGAPLVADMSSDILAREIDAGQFALIYGGAQKNLGPAGVTVVLLREELLARSPKTLPTTLRYDVYAKNNSLYNTPPVFAIYLLDLVLRWIKDEGGAAAMERRNRRKAAAVYAAIDDSGGFYAGHAEPGSRSLMNITFRLPTPELESRFAKEAEAQGMIGLKGHRSVGGIRASLYNALGEDGANALAQFMGEFARRNG